MGHDYDTIIIGSGFGGSVAAYRLAEKGKKVCLLERGRAYPPHSFPRSPHKMKRNFWDPSAGLYGLFDIWSFKGVGGVVSSGLGGGSLIYANVLKRKDEEWFVRESSENGGYENWPVTRKELDPHYDQVEKRMNAQPYPFNDTPFDRAGKTQAMQDAAGTIGGRFELLNLAVSFRCNDYDPSNPNDPANKPRVGEPIKETVRRNFHGSTRTTCQLCGECDIGCNFGSKNTLDHNYLSEAQFLGAHIETLCEVRSFEPISNGGYRVRFVRHNLNDEGVKKDTSKMELKDYTCGKLIVSAGTFGSTYLLLKNRASFPRISRKLGSHFSTNGDFLSFMVDSTKVVNGVKQPRVIDPSFGPVITSAIRMGDAADSGANQVVGGDLKRRGFYIEDGGYPEYLNWMLETADMPGFAERFFIFGKRYLSGLLGWNPDHDISAEVAALFGSTQFTMSSMPMLTMGRDIPNGQMKLKGKNLDVDWVLDSSSEYFNRVNDTLKKLAGELGATYKANLSWYLSQILTAHPLGGCPMGDNENNGVVNKYGEVFNYPGLYVIDGSMMPGPVGPNPSLTIAALSDFCCDRM